VVHHIMAIMLASTLCDVRFRSGGKQRACQIRTSHNLRLDLVQEGHKVLVVSPVFY